MPRPLLLTAKRCDLKVKKGLGQNFAADGFYGPERQATNQNGGKKVSVDGGILVVGKIHSAT